MTQAMSRCEDESMATPTIIHKTNKAVATTIRNTSCSRGWLKQLNQILFGTITVVIFVLLMMVVLHEAVMNNLDDEDDDCDGCERCVVVNCHVMCTNTGFTGNVDDEISRQIMQANADCTGIGLSIELSNPLFPNGRLPFAWLSAYHINITSLEISGGNLRYIPPAAFLSISFVNLKSLTLTDVIISQLQGESFFGLARLIELNIRSSTLTSIDKNVLGPISDSLKVLQIKESKRFDPKNLTGGVSMLKNLEIVDLTFNDFGNILNNRSFSRLKYCKSLSLSASKITAIEQGTFDSLEHIETIKLDNNFLTTLKPRLFGRIVRFSPNFKLNLQNNPWHCDCNLENVRLMYQRSYLTDDPLCVSPIEHQNVLFSSLDSLCDKQDMTDFNPRTTANSISVEQSTPSNSVESTTELSSRRYIHYYNTLCDDPGVNRNVTFSCNGELTAFEDWLVDVLINNQADNEYSVLLRKAAIVLWNGLKTGLGTISGDEYSAVWFKSLCPTEIFCLRGSLANTIDLNLSNIAYVFCLVHTETRIIQADNCVTYVATSIEILRENNPNFLTRASITSIFALTVIGCMFASACVVYIAVRKHPTLLRGSKRVLLVQHRVADALILPPKFPERCKLTRRESKISVVSGTPSYISALQPTEEQLAIWRLSYHFDTNSSMISNTITDTPKSNIEEKIDLIDQEVDILSLDNANHI